MTSTTAAPVRFTQRPDRSLVLGLSATRAVTLTACVLAVAAATVTSGMTAGLITAVGSSPVAGSALLMVEGRALIEWAPDALRYVSRGVHGRLRFLAKPGRPVPAGVLPIPGTAQQLSVLQTADGTAILRDKTADTWTAIAAIAGNGFLYADPETQDAACAGFGRTLAAIASDGQIQRIHLIHRTTPETVETDDTARDLTLTGLTVVVDSDGGDASPQSMLHPARAPRTVTTSGTRPISDARAGAPPAAAAIYGQTCQEHAAAWRHDTLIAITIGGKAGRAAIHRAGHGTTAAARVLDAHRTGLADTIAEADATVETWLTPADLTDWVRDGYDPASTSVTRRLRGALPAEPLPPDSSSTGARPPDAAGQRSPAGPVAVAETWSSVHTDSAWHQVLWISNWPRFDTHPAFLAPLLLPAGATVTVTLIYEPVPTADALRQIGRDKVAQASDAALRRRLGTLETAEQAARSADTAQREADLAAGHLDMRHTALIAITAVTHDELTDATTRIRQAAAAVGCDTRILYGQQLAALSATILPTGPRL
jgi:hypothetical protein